VSLPQTPTHQQGVDGAVGHASSIYTLFFVTLVVAQLLFGCGFGTQHVTSVDHCIDTLSDYSPEREPCTDRAFSLCHGVLSGFVFQHCSPGDTTPRHHEKLLIPATGIVPSDTREYEDTFPCWLLLFPCTSLKNHIPVLHTGIDISYRLTQREF
jgi:hypothetical protein